MAANGLVHDIYSRPADNVYRVRKMIYVPKPSICRQELIQNADDAGATEVKFFLDCRDVQTLHPELIDQEMHEEHLPRFRGPALLAYNNAPFTEQDWKGIRKLQQSGKAENPLKVGRFGIGFNSVYHITGTLRCILC